jgi:hypothetical protein
MSSRRFISMIPVLIAFAFGGINAQAQTTSSTETRTFTLPAVGLASTETAQVNVANISSSSLASGTVPSCSGTITFLSSSGAAIGSATSFSNVASGNIFSATLPFSAFGVSSSSRPVFRAIVSLVQTLEMGVAPCNLGISLEIYDTASGVTHAVLTSAQLVPALVPVGPVVPLGPGLR